MMSAVSINVHIYGSEQFCLTWEPVIQACRADIDMPVDVAVLCCSTDACMEGNDAPWCCVLEASCAARYFSAVKHEDERPETQVVCIGDELDVVFRQYVHIWLPAASSPHQVGHAIRRIVEGFAPAVPAAGPLPEAVFDQVLQMALLLNSQRSFDDLFRAVVQQVSAIMRVDRTSLFVLDEKRGELWTQVAEGVDGQIRIKVGRGLAGLCARQQRPLLVNDVHGHPDFDSAWEAKLGYTTRNILCFPVFNREQEIKGVLQMLNRHHGEFSSSDMNLAAVCAAQVGVALENRQMYEELRLGFESFIRALTATIDAKHPLTAGHSHRVTRYAMHLGRAMKIAPEDLHRLKYAAMLHDIGKIGVPDRVLTKNGRFDPDEVRIMQEHPRWTGHILKQMLLPQGLENLPLIAASHHERMDGKGYPTGIGNGDIPVLARIIAVADVFDALTSRRDYPKYLAHEHKDHGHDPLPLEKAFGIIAQGRGTQFDPQVVDVFMQERERMQAMWQELHRSSAEENANG